MTKAITNRGVTYGYMERDAEALMDLTRAIELDPRYEFAIASRGVTYVHMSRYPEALSDLTRAIELDPEDKWGSHLAVSPMAICLAMPKR